MHIPHARALHNKIVLPQHVPYVNCAELANLFDNSRIAIDFVTQMYITHDHCTKSYNVRLIDVNGDEVSFIVSTTKFLWYLRHQIGCIEDYATGESRTVKYFTIQHAYPSKQETYEMTVTIFVLSVVVWCILRQVY